MVEEAFSYAYCGWFNDIHMEQKLQPIDMLLPSNIAKQVAENWMKLKSILKTVILSGCQNLTLNDTIMTLAHLVLIKQG